MLPTLMPGEKVMINYAAYSGSPPKRWDIVAFEPPQKSNEMWVMRVAALPGETVTFATNRVTVNGVQLTPPAHMTNITYVSLDHSALRFASRQVSEPYVVPPESFFLLGDNSTNSNDSRMWGAVHRTNIIGRVKSR